ncbi:hypothetical protein [Microbacterium sp. NPDC079995]|uniref:hypothetical protein n=2 Tax=unclassified Microbacterium TaxID=2609290 RepID=UPI00344DE038
MARIMIIIGAALVVLLIIGTIVAFAIAAARRSRSEDDAGSLVRVTRVIGVLWVMFAAVGAVANLLLPLLTPAVTITMPIQEFWPQLPSTVDLQTDATRVSGGFTSATLVVEGLTPLARALWGISQMIVWTIPVVIALFVVMACSRLLEGAAFAPVVAKMATTTGAVVAFGGVAAQIMGDIAGSIASTQLFGAKGGSWEGDYAGIGNVFDAWVPASTVQISFPFWPVAVGLAFAVLGAILRSGARLQNDVKGLV